MGPVRQREPLCSWRHISFLLLAIILILIFAVNVPRGTHTPLGPSTGHAETGHDVVDIDKADGLTDAECSARFPDLFTEIHRAMGYWKSRNHVITSEDVQIRPEQAALRLLIHDNEIRILESRNAVELFKSTPDRTFGALHLLQRALDSAMAAGETLDPVEVSMHFRDDPELSTGTHSFWSFDRNISDDAHQQLWLMPNFDWWYYISTESFDDAKRRAIQHDAPFTSKVQKIVWRGNAEFGPEIRKPLIETTRDKAWADVTHVGHHEEDAYMRVDQYCKYAMTVYTEGVTYSGRLKFLLECNSLLFAHEIVWATHYSHLLQADGPDQNYVSVKRDWSDLETKVKHYLENPAESEKIIANSLKTFRARYSTRAAISCYIRALIRGYSSVAFTPNLTRPSPDGEISMQRGVSYAKFLNDPKDINFEIY